MEGRREADPVRVFHLFERILDVGLGPAAQNDLLCCPTVVVSTEDAFTEAGAFEVFEGVGVYPKSEVQPSASVKDFGFKDLSGVLARGNGIKAFFQGLSAIAFALGLGPVALKKLLMELLKGSPLFS